MNTDTEHLVSSTLDNVFFESILQWQGQISPYQFVFNLLLCILLSGVVSLFYKRYVLSFSDKSKFANNFVLLATITMIVISIVKSSLALSLGLVGALSIVRFRTRIKETEELIYLFFCIAIGLGLGANQTFVTIISSLILLSFIYIKSKRDKKIPSERSMYLLIKTTKKILVNDILKCIQPFTNRIDLKKYNFQDSQSDFVFTLELKNVSSFDNITKALKKIDPKINLTHLEPET